MDCKNINLAHEESLAIITINRPPVNAFNEEVIVELNSLLDYLEESEQVRAIIITGSGKAFVAGADISGFLKMGEADADAFIAEGQKLFNRIETYPKIVIAAVNGICLGGGCEMAMACDLRFAAESVKFGQPEINLGLIPGWGGTQRLPSLIGKTKAMEFLLTGSTFTSQEALSLGLVNKVFADSALIEESKKIAARLALQPPLAIKAIKELLSNGHASDFTRGLNREREAFVSLLQTEDAQEGIKAFLDKKKPVFKGK
ncbi:MAG: enoyl-CoA hydratase/isomerase family protein [Dethiobacteria bacterium]|jgi:enoyl-CoA hydratase/carnithine racemase